MPQRDRGRRDAERDESQKCKDERSLGRTAGDVSRERTGKANQVLYAAGNSPPQSDRRGGRWSEDGLRRRDEHLTRPTSTGIEPELSVPSLRRARRDCKEISCNFSKNLTTGHSHSVHALATSRARIAGWKSRGCKPFPLIELEGSHAISVDGRRFESQRGMRKMCPASSRRLCRSCAQPPRADLPLHGRPSPAPVNGPGFGGAYLWRAFHPALARRATLDGPSGAKQTKLNRAARDEPRCHFVPLLSGVPFGSGSAVFFRAFLHFRGLRSISNRECVAARLAAERVAKQIHLVLVRSPAKRRPFEPSHQST